MAIEDRFLEVMEIGIRNAGWVCRQFHGKVTKEKKKGQEMSNDVSAVDRACQNILLQCAQSIEPGIAVVAEEDTELYRRMSDNQHEYLVIIDPLDGTANYLGNVKQKSYEIKGWTPEENYGVMAALSKQGKVVSTLLYTPHNEDLYFAVNGKGAFLKRKGETQQIKVGGCENNIYYNTAVGRDEQLMSKLEKISNLQYPHCIVTAVTNITKGLARGIIMKNANLHDIAPTSLFLAQAGGYVCNQDRQEIISDKVHLKTPWVIFADKKETAEELLEFTTP